MVVGLSKSRHLIDEIRSMYRASGNVLYTCALVAAGDCRSTKVQTLLLQPLKGTHPHSI